MGKKIGIAVGIIILVAALVVCLIPLKTVAYTVMVDYQDTETYYEDEPYQLPLDYEVTKSYVGQDTITHETSTVIGGIGESHHTWEETIPVACVVVQNIDTISGTFNVSFSVSEPLDELFLHRTLSLDPNEAQTAECPAYKLGDWNYEVTPSTKTEYKQVEKQRTVTKQRPETRYKEVTLLDYLLHYY